MIPLTRVRGTAEIHSNFINPRRENYNRELLIERREHFLNPAEKQEFDKSRWKKAKIQLLKESNDKCAYCEASTATVSYGDVEHYRPTSKYWWLAYCYENYLPSCQICNQKYKKANFRVLGAKMRSPAIIRGDTSDAFIESKKGRLTPDSLDAGSVFSFTRIHKAEHAFIVNPYFDVPADWFAWKADDVTKRVRLVSARNTPSTINVVKAAERDLGLNVSVG